VALARGTPGHLGLDVPPHFELASWSPDVPAADPQHGEYAGLATAANALLARVRKQYVGDAPYIIASFGADRLLLRCASYASGHWWHTLLVPTPPAVWTFEEVKRLLERLRRLVEGELHGWLDGLLEAPSTPTGTALFRVESEILSSVFPDAELVGTEASAGWGRLAHRVSYFAAHHEESVREWVSKVTAEADQARFAPEKLNRTVLEASGLLRPEVAEAIGETLGMSRDEAKALTRGEVQLNWLPALAAQLGLPSPNMLFMPAPAPRIPIDHYQDLGLWFSRFTTTVAPTPEGNPRLAAVAKRLAEFGGKPANVRDAWDEEPPAELEAVALDLRHLGYIACASMGVRFVADLPLGLLRPGQVSILTLVPLDQVLTENGLLSDNNHLMKLTPQRDPVTPEWLARFNAPRFSAADLIAYSDKVAEMREPDEDDKDRFTVRVLAGIRTFKRDPEKSHAATVRMEALAALMTRHDIAPWVRKSAATDGSTMVSQAAFAATAECELIAVGGEPGFDYKSFYRLCVTHAHDH
jgi:hypothetical protein